MNEPKGDPQQSDDPYVEPENSTVDDWHGQEVQRDIDAADAALEEADGDEATAEEIFDAERPSHPSDEFKVPEEDRP